MLKFGQMGVTNLDMAAHFNWEANCVCSFGILSHNVLCSVVLQVAKVKTIGRIGTS